MTIPVTHIDSEMHSQEFGRIEIEGALAAEAVEKPGPEVVETLAPGLMALALAFHSLVVCEATPRLASHRRSGLYHAETS